MKKLIFLLIGISIMNALKLYSPDIKQKISIEQVYGMCGGENISPELRWGNAPADTKSFAITMYDPDAPTEHGWWHWMVVNIPSKINFFPRNAGSVGNKYFNLGLQCVNDYGEVGYGGPCPPPGKPHRYIITIYALDVAKLNVSKEINPQKLYSIILSHTIQKDSIKSLYKRGWK